MGRIKFEWAALESAQQYGAVYYRLEVTYPNGNVEAKELEDTSFERYLESLPVGGEYRWRVAALDGNGEEICAAGPRVFYKEHFMNP